jgi:sulfur carrier protein
LNALLACYNFFMHNITASNTVNITVNGRSHSIHAALSVAALLMSLEKELPLAGKRFAVERNGEIVPKSVLATTPVAAGDVFEIVIAVGGG